MLSIKECWKILNEDGKKYTDEEIKKIRQILYELAEVDYAASRDLHARINRRTS